MSEAIVQPAPGPQRSRGAAYTRGLASGWLVTGATALTGLWLAPFTLRHLSRDEYGIFTLANDALLWFSLIDFGVTGAVIVKASRMLRQPDQAHLNRLLSTAFVTQNVVTAAILVLGAALPFGFASFFSLPPEIQADARLTLWLLVASTAIQAYTKTFTALLIASRRIHVDNLLRLLALAVRTGLVVLLLVQGYRLPALAWASLAASALTATATVVIVRKELTTVRLRWSLASWAELSEIGRVGLWFALNSVAYLAIRTLDHVVAARVLSLSAVTSLALTGRVYDLAQQNLVQISSTAWPLLGELFGERRHQQASRVFGDLLRLSVGSGAIVIASIWAANEAFVRSWVGAVNYAGQWADVFLALNVVVLCWVHPFRSVLSAAEVVRPQALARLAEGILFVVGCIILGREFGLAGVAAAKAAAGLLSSAIWMPRLTRRLMEGHGRSLFAPHTMFVTRALSFAALSGVAGRTMSAAIGGFLGSGAGALTAAVLGSALMWRWCLTADERARLSGAVLARAPHAIRGSQPVHGQPRVAPGPDSLGDE